MGGNEAQAHPTFGLSSLMLVIALAAVCFGVIREVPGLGIPLAVVATPALVRTFGVVGRRRAKGQTMTTLEQLGAFLGSVSVVATIGVASGAAFFGTCWIGFFGGAAVSSPWARGYDPIGWGLVTGILLGTLIASFVAYRVFRRLWTEKE